MLRLCLGILENNFLNRDGSFVKQKKRNNKKTTKANPWNPTIPLRSVLTRYHAVAK
jgi:hypothetical protein